MNDNIIVLLCNKKYLDKCIKTIFDLKTIGKYNKIEDKIILIKGDDWDLNNISKEYKNIIENNCLLIHFSDLNLDEIHKKHLEYPYSSPWDNHISKTFQWHKFYIFHSYFKQYKKILYLDVGIKIYSDIHPLFKIDCTNKLLAHSDAYPYQNGWKLKIQFEMEANKDCAVQLENNYNLDIDYFQSTIMLFDTNIISDNTFDELIKLMNKYPISKTNEQAIMNLYFNCDKKFWKQIPLGYYDYMRRENYNYILTKI